MEESRKTPHMFSLLSESDLNFVDWCSVGGVWRALQATTHLHDADSEEAVGTDGKAGEED